MKQLRIMVCLVLVLVGGMFSLRAQDKYEGQKQDGTQPSKKSVRRMEVKRYMGVAPNVVNQAVTRGLKRDVRFSDTYEGFRRPPRSLRRVTYKGKNYRIAAMIRTGSNLYLLVPADHKNTLENLQQPDPMPEGQKITIEATTLGVAAPGGVLLLDRMITGEDGKSKIKHQMVVRWPGVRGVDSKRINEPGEHSITFPCRSEQGKQAKIRLVVKKRERGKFLEEIGEQKEKTEDAKKENGNTQDEEEKKYRKFEPTAVYRHIRQNNKLDVEFADKVKGTPPSVGSSIRLPNGRRMKLGAAFDTYGGITCLVPKKNEEIVEMVNRLIPGQKVKIWGSTLPSLRQFRPIVVDKVEVPGSSGPGQSPDVWDVTLFWSDIESVRFYKLGSYNLTFPCQHKDDREERVKVELREVRVIPED